ncbi:MAG: 16S rRNA (cytosine(967)-C(5))-methyltransferase RsmB [Peptococcaceae bacterium]|nr:16S rRNA (cytosine(967)-C(5))-methyltransferase RsmB [Peptococcaceae bacterium]
MKDNVRKIAYDVLMDIEFNGAYANLALDKALLRSKLNATDKRLVTELVYGTTKMKLHLDTVLSAYCDLKHTNKKIILLLRMALYQVLYLEKIPDHAILNESVELAKAQAPHTAGFVNAVLRHILRSEKTVSWPDKRRSRNQYYAKWYSFPQWIIDSWVKEYGFDNTEKLCAYFNEPAATWIRVNTLKASPDDVAAKLEFLGVDFMQHPQLPEAFKISSLQPLQNSDLFKKGQVIVQDLSAMLPAVVLNPQKNQRILDMCAAPGGKTTHLSAIMNDSGEIFACDIHSHRTGLIEENAKRLGTKNITCLTEDATALPVQFHHAFDGILLDAPCSGLGVLNRRADLRWRVRRSNLAEIEALQANLLDAAVKYLKPKGTLVYSTCTLNPKENTIQVEKFLARHDAFELEAFTCLGEQHPSGMTTIYPFDSHSDGFFIAKLVRKD